MLRKSDCIIPEVPIPLSNPNSEAMSQNTGNKITRVSYPRYGGIEIMMIP
jgi:hypothetical protein